MASNTKHCHLLSAWRGLVSSLLDAISSSELVPVLVYCLVSILHASETGLQLLWQRISNLASWLPTDVDTKSLGYGHLLFLFCLFLFIGLN